MDQIELNDISNNLLIINKVTIERLFEQENQNALILYLFYYKTAKWQNNNTIKASDDYCKKILHWGIDKLQIAKKMLIEMNLIEIIKRTNEKKQIIGWYIKVKYYSNSTIPETTIPITPHVGKQETNTINNNNILTNIYTKNTINNKDIKENNISKDILKESNEKNKKFIPPTLEEIEEYCKKRNNNVDAKAFYDYFNEGDWKDSQGNKVKNWKQKIITWEKYNFNKNKSHEEVIYENI